MPITGAVADALGIQMAMRLQVVVVLLVLPLTLLLPSEAHLQQMHEAPAAAADD